MCWIKVYELPQGGRTSRGKPIVNLLPLEEGEKISTILPVKEFTRAVRVYGDRRRHGQDAARGVLAA